MQVDEASSARQSTVWQKAEKDMLDPCHLLRVLVELWNLEVSLRNRLVEQQLGQDTDPDSLRNPDLLARSFSISLLSTSS